jgi:hypothetical protein
VGAGGNGVEGAGCGGRLVGHACLLESSAQAEALWQARFAGPRALVASLLESKAASPAQPARQPYLCLSLPLLPANRRCQAGAEKLQEALDEVWPDDREEPEAGLQDMAICPGTPFKVSGRVGCGDGQMGGAESGSGS